LGANGAGKSSVLNAVAGLIEATAGAILLQGSDIVRFDPAVRIDRGLAIVLEGRGVLAEMSVRENLELGAYAKPELRSIRARQAEIERVVDLFPRLGNRFAQLAGTLSGGEQQMLAIGRALMASPKVLLLDEPSFGLAPRVVEEISTRLRELSRSTGMAILVSEQNAVLGLDFAERGYVLRSGRVVLEGNSSQLRSNKDLVRLYLGG